MVFASSFTRTVGWCMSLSATRRTACSSSARTSGSSSGSRRVEPGQLAVDDAGRHRAQRDHGGGHAGEPAGVEERLDLLGDDAADAEHVADALAPRRR